MQDFTIVSTDPPLRQCSKCKEWLPPTLDYFCKNTSRAIGLRTSCKKCDADHRAATRDAKNARSRVYREENKAVISEKLREYYKKNPHKKTEQQKKYYAANKEKRVEYEKKYRATNQEKVSARVHAHYEVHKDEILRYSHDYYEKNKERVSARNKVYRDKNREKTREQRKAYQESRKTIRKEYQEKYLELNREKIAKKAKEYRRLNKEKINAGTRRRRAVKLFLPATFTDVHWQRSLDYFKGCCAVCERPLMGIFHTAHADHWIALSDPNCPGSVPENMIPLCGGIDGCNQKKHAQDPTFWLTEEFGKRKAEVILNRINEYFEFVRQQE